MKRLLFWVSYVAFWTIPIGTIAAIWHLPLWKIPATALIVFVCIFGGRVLADTLRKMEELGNEQQHKPKEERKAEE